MAKASTVQLAMLWQGSVPCPRSYTSWQMYGIIYHPFFTTGSGIWTKLNPKTWGFKIFHVFNCKSEKISLSMPLISFLSFQTRRYRKRTNEKMQQNTRDLKSGLNLNKYARNRTQFDAISACRSNKKKIKNHIVLQISITQSYCWSSLS